MALKNNVSINQIEFVIAVLIVSMSISIKSINQLKPIIRLSGFFLEKADIHR